MVRDAVRDYNHETRKSAELAAREADVEARAYAAWVAARKDGDWEAFAPSMEEVRAGTTLFGLLLLTILFRTSVFSLGRLCCWFCC